MRRNVKSRLHLVTKSGYPSRSMTFIYLCSGGRRKKSIRRRKLKHALELDLHPKQQPWIFPVDKDHRKIKTCNCILHNYCKRRH